MEVEEEVEEVKDKTKGSKGRAGEGWWRWRCLTLLAHMGVRFSSRPLRLALLLCLLPRGLYLDRNQLTTISGDAFSALVNLQ